jgi:hypothetical protein
MNPRMYDRESALADMLSCDYNGWSDVPEDEREGLDVFFSENARGEAPAGCHDTTRVRGQPPTCPLACPAATAACRTLRAGLRP